ncbi:MAG: hypothetical protein H6559_34110 [Lewinellaceae bacterium]|nr:hypothetical protein [Lewinellaceae bacterium]
MKPIILLFTGLVPPCALPSTPNWMNTCRPRLPASCRLLPLKATSTFRRR